MIVSNAPSMRTAAARLMISPAAVSQAIARLEREFGVPLLERGARGIRLTPAGSVLRQKTSVMLEAAGDLIDSLDEFKASALPRLRMYVLESAAHALFPALVTALTDLVGELSILSSRRYAPEEIILGIWDILIASEDLSHIPNIESHPIFRERLVALVPADLLKEEGSLRGVALRAPHLHSDRARRHLELTMRYIREAGIETPRQIDCPSTGSMLDLVEGGMGWTISTPLMLCRMRPSRERIAWVVLPPAYNRVIYVSVEKDRLLDLPLTLVEKCRSTLLAEIATWPEFLAPEAREAVEVLGL